MRDGTSVRRSALLLTVAAAMAVSPAAPAAADGPRFERLSNEHGRTYWSEVQRAVPVRAQPDHHSRKTGALHRFTYYGRTDVVLALRRSGNWVQVRYSGLGRRTGWVPSSAISPPRLNRTW